MNIPSKREVVIVVVGLVSAFAFGRYSAQSSETEKITKTVQANTESNEHKDTHVQTRTVTVKAPTGAVTTTTVTDTTITDAKVKDSQVSTVATKEVEKQSGGNGSKINVSIIVAEDLHNPGIPLYGVSAQKEFIGPITIGAFGLTNGTVGLSLGINF